MKREILFRGKRDDNGEWLFGDLVRINELMCIFPINSSPFESEDFPECYTVKPETVGQYTELKTKPETKIFEGDIVRYGLPYHGEITQTYEGKIVYNSYCGAFQIAYLNIYDKFVTDFAHKFTIIEVIGNIHDNPKLLK